jgi:hypothetical protein
MTHAHVAGEVEQDGVGRVELPRPIDDISCGSGQPKQELGITLVTGTGATHPFVEEIIAVAHEDGIGRAYGAEVKMEIGARVLVHGAIAGGTHKEGVVIAATE